MVKMSRGHAPDATASNAPAVPLDTIDRRILDLLSSEGRASIREVAERARIGRATAYNRIQRLQDTGVVRGFTVVLDPRKAGVGLAAYVYIKIDQHAWRSVGQLVAQVPGVDHVSLVSGEFDLLVLVRVHDPSDLRDVILERLHAIEGVTATQTTFVLDEVDGVGGLFGGAHTEKLADERRGSVTQ